jgi:hypothetical protein
LPVGGANGLQCRERQERSGECERFHDNGPNCRSTSALVRLMALA